MEEYIKIDDIRQNKKLMNLLFCRMIDLELKITEWRLTNSQSNPGAVMELRDMKKQLQTIQKIIGFS